MIRTQVFLFILAWLILPLTLRAQVLEGEAARAIIPQAQLIRQKPFSRVPNYVKLDPERALPQLSWQDWLTQSLGLRAEIDFDLLSSEKDKLGHQHHRFQQTFASLPVEGSMWLVHEDAQGIYALNGDVHDFDGIVLETHPALSPQAALGYALADADAKCYAWDNAPQEYDLPEPQLVILPDLDNLERRRFSLAYKIDVYSFQPLSRTYTYVDAHTGEILKKLDRIHSTDVPGTAHTKYHGIKAITTDSIGATTYRLRENGRGGGISTFDLNTSIFFGNAIDFVDANNVWTTSLNQDDAALDAHYGTEKTYDYFWSRFGRNSIDGAGFPLKSYVHYNANYVNAFWNGQVMSYGDGNGVDFTALTSIDIVAHEVTHGLTQYTAGLIYQNEPGALNESFSDIFGVAIDFYAHPFTANYYMGDLISTSGVNGSFRNMANPNQFSDPDTYFGTYWYTSTGDNGGVHINSGVQNFWYFLLSNGGSGTNDLGHSYNLTGIGREDAAAIAFRNLSVYLTPVSEYADAHFYSLIAAQDLFGACSPELIQTTKAWYAVGLGTDYSPLARADFGVDKTFACSLNDTLSFHSLSLNAMVHSWDFGDGSIDSVANPSHVYSAAGRYTVRLAVADSGSCGSVDTVLKQQLVTVRAGGPLAASCSPATVNPDIYPRGIFQVQLNSLNHSSLGSVEGYQDYSCDYAINVIEGRSYPILVRTAPFWANDVRVWIDYDNDGSFHNATETALSTTRKYGSHSGTVNIPSPALYNVPLRMRVWSDSSRSGFVPGGCSLPIRGQVEDYTVIILRDTFPPTPDFSVNTQIVLPGGTATFTDLSTPAPTSWNWTFPGGVPAHSTQQNPQVNYPVLGTYPVSLRVSNSFGTDSISRQSYITVTNSVNMCNQAQTTSASGTVFDSGGPLGPYNNSENCSFLISPPCATSVTLTVGSLATESCCDRLFAFDGPTTASPLLFSVSGNVPPPVAIANSGEILLVFYSDGSATGAGFQASWTSAIPSGAGPTAAFQINDTLPPLNAAVRFTDQTSNSPISWFWDFGDGVTSFLPNPTHAYSAPGSYLTTLVVNNCYGADTLSRSLHVQSGPSLSFQPDTLRATISGCDDSVKLPLWIANQGGGDLIYRIDGGNNVNYDSSLTQNFNAAGQKTLHAFEGIDPRADTLTVIVTISGDFDQNFEFADLYVDSLYIRQVNDRDGPANVAISDTFIFWGTQARNWLKDGRLIVSLDNSSYVGSYGFHSVQVLVQGIPWLSFFPLLDTVAVGDSGWVDVWFKSEGLASGSYYHDVLLYHNDSLPSPQVIPCIMTLLGQAAFELSDSCLDLGSQLQRAPGNDSLILYNSGCDSLYVQQVSTSSSQFKVDTSAFVIPPFAQDTLIVTFVPDSVGSYQSQLLLQTSVGDSLVCLSGAGLAAPVIYLSPDTLRANLTDCDDSTQVALWLYNFGEGALSFQLALPGEGGNSLDSVLSRLNSNFSQLNSLIPNRFDFNEGDVSNRIADGGLDMFDYGNYLNTSLSLNIFYSENVVQSQLGFGLAGQFFTRKYPGLFLMAGDLDGIGYVEITGGLGADGLGVADGFVLNHSHKGKSYKGFVKRVHSTTEPSVNHLFIVEDSPGLSQNFTTNTNSDQHRLTGLANSSRVYYLMYGGLAGQVIDSAATLLIMQSFLSIIEPSPAWLSYIPGNGQLLSGDSLRIDVLMNGLGLNAGMYASHLLVYSNDPVDSLLQVPVRLEIEGRAKMLLSDTCLVFDSTMQYASAQRELYIKNEGCDTLDIQLLSASSYFVVDTPFLSLLPGASDTLRISFLPDSVGSFADSLRIYSNDVDSLILLKGEGLGTAEASLAPDSISAILYGCNDSLILPVTLYNSGSIPLQFHLQNTQGTAGDSTRMLALTYGVDYFAEYRNTLLALNQYYTRYRLTETATTLPAVLSQALLDADIVLMPEFENGLASVFTGFAIPLQNFVNQGGVVIMLGSGNSPHIFNTGLLSGNYGGQIFSGVLDVINNSHPLTDSLPPSFAASSATTYLSISNPDAVSLVTYDDGVNTFDAVSYREMGQGKIVYLPFDYFNYNSFSARLLANAVEWGSHPGLPGWVSPDPDSGMVAVGDSITLQVTLHAQGLLSGLHQTHLQIFTNDPLNPVLDLPIDLQVQGQALLQVSDSCLDFDTVLQFVSRIDTLMLSNPGCDTLSLHINSNSAYFIPDSLNLFILPGEQYPLEVRFSPDSVGYFYGGLQIMTNDRDTLICLEGLGKGSARLRVSPDSLSVNLNGCNDTLLLTLNVYSEGTGALDWRGYSAGNAFDESFDPAFDPGNWSGLSGAQVSDQCGYHSAPNALFFGFVNGQRRAASKDLNTRGGGTLDFYLKISSGGTGCEDADPGEEVYLEYSNDAGASWNFIAIYSTTAYPVFTLVQQTIPVPAQTGSTRFRWTQYNNSGSSFDSWALDDISYGGSNLIQVLPDSGRIAVDDSQTVTVLISSSGLNVGQYQNQILIRSNDPLQPGLSIPLTLTVNGMAEIGLVDTCLYVDTIMEHTSTRDTLMVFNPGCDSLVLNASLLSNYYQLLPASLSLAPGDSQQIVVTFLPDSMGPFIDSLKLQSNVGDTSVCLNGWGEGAPIPRVQPDSIFQVLSSCQDSFVHLLNLYNEGDGSMDYKVRGASVADTVEILALVNGVDYSGEYQNMLSALQLYFNAFNLEESFTQSPHVLDSLLEGKHVLLVPEVEFGSITHFGAIATLLDSFVREGGTVIFCGSYYLSNQHIFDTGLFSGLYGGTISTSLDDMDVVLPGHPLSDSLPSVIYPVGATVYMNFSNPDIVRVITYDSGNSIHDLVSFRQLGSGKVIYLPYDYYSYHDEASRLIANAVKWGGSGDIFPPWLDVQPETGQLAMMDSSQLRVTFKPLGLDTGLHHTLIEIVSNDPLNPTLQIPVTLRILDDPVMALPGTCLNFGTMDTGMQSSQTFWVHNTGCSPMQVHQVISSDTVFGVTPGQFSVPPGDSLQLTVAFHPDSNRSYSSQLQFISNAFGDSSYCLVGNAIIPPVLSLTQDSLLIRLPACGAIDSLYLPIQNLGERTLYIDPDSVTVPWLQSLSMADSLAPDSSKNFGWVFSSLGLTAGSYSTLLYLDSNDPNQGRISVPCTLEVGNEVCANFLYIPYTTCSGAFNFFDSSMNSPNIWQWDFGDGQTDSVQHPVHRYTQSGTYQVSLIACNLAGCDTLSQTLNVSAISGPGFVSCYPQTLNACCGTGIYEVRLNAIQHSSGGSTEGYQDYTCTAMTELRRGHSYPLEVVTGDSLHEDVRAWIDYNDNGIFEAHELILQSDNQYQIHRDSFTVPMQALLNQPLRMRVGSEGTAFSPPGPCMDVQQGQFEDYTIRMLPTQLPPLPAFGFQIQDSCGEQVQFADQSAFSPTQWHWDFGDGDSSLLQHPIHQYQQSGTYSVIMTASNAWGTNSDTQTLTVLILSPEIQVQGALQAGNSIRFEAIPSSLAAYTWHFGDGDSSNQAQENHTYAQPGTYVVSLKVEGNQGCVKMAYDTLLIDIGLGIRDVPPEGFRVYPNPTRRSFFVEFVAKSAQVTLTVFNPLGQHVFYQTLQGRGVVSEKISLPFNRSEGVYLIRIQDGDQVYFHRLEVWN